MSKHKHTPGPWKVTDLNQHPGIDKEDESVSIVIFGYRKGLDADPFDDAGVRGRTRNEAIANAHLIAAAPELLEALESIVECLEYSDDLPACMDMARAAISKAKGGANE